MDELLSSGELGHVDWVTTLRKAEATGVFRSEPFDDEDRLPSLWSRLRNLAETSDSSDVADLSNLLSQVASFSPRPDDWLHPYEPMLNMHEGRTADPSDLTPDQIETLAAVALFLPDTLLRARVCDVLGIRSSRKERMHWFQCELDALNDLNVTGASWHRNRGYWDRALHVGRRQGPALQERLQLLAGTLTEYALSADAEEHPGSVADLLSKHGLARHKAAAIADRMRDLAATSETPHSDFARGYLHRAAQWYEKAGQRDDAHLQRLLMVQSLINEAENLDSTVPSGTHTRSGHLYERALKELRRIPRLQREALGVADLTSDLAIRIRAAGAAALGSMGVFRSDAIDLTDLRKQSVAAVSNKEPVDALRAFIGLTSIPSYEADRNDAKALVEEHPLQSLFANVHYSQEGRVIHRSSGQGGEPIYGVDPSVWRQMIQTYEFRIRLEVQGALAPAWLALSNEHRLTVADFLQLTRGSSIVPADRERLLAQALFYGYDGDFITAAQLLAPQMEHIVRIHMRNAGQSTTTIDERGIENEIGLSALMSREAAVEIFGEDIAYGVRALFCGPIGPNLRNHFAHGLADDSWVGSADAVYCWWFMLRLVFVPFLNLFHDAQTADSHEPAERQRPDTGSNEEP